MQVPLALAARSKRGRKTLLYAKSTVISVQSSSYSIHNFRPRFSVFKMSFPGERMSVAAIPNITCNNCSVMIEKIKDYLEVHDPNISHPDEPPPTALLGRYPLGQVQTSGLNGCHVCSIMSQGQCPAHSEQDIVTSSSSFITVYRARNISGNINKDSPLVFLDVRMTNATGKRVPGSSDVTLSIEPKLKYSSHEVINGPLSTALWSRSTGSDGSINLAQHWLAQCISQHKLCKEIGETPTTSRISTFPTFLVDVTPGRIRLCRSKDIQHHPQYLTLSHRWGGSHIFRLTSHNLSALLENINIEELPRTFKDAVNVTQRLGYQYIWIDSLCIVQDSVEHWRSESAIMGDIYRGSICTIAALGATDGDSGCFKVRNPLCFQHFTFKLKSGQTVFMPPSREKTILRHTGYRSTVEPLQERAWVIQERMLSPRTIFFGTFGLYWECGTGLVETNIYGPELREGSPTTKYILHKACNLPVSGEFDEGYREFWKWWISVISMYNPCGLTYGSDKLVAIAGIVKLVESKTGLHNVAGLWKEYIVPELLWIVDNPLIRNTKAYQAPTWSWASLNGEVSAGIQDFNYTFNWTVELLDVVADLAAENGQLSGGHIKVRGPLMQVRWETGENGYKLRWGSSPIEEHSADDRVVFLPDVEPEPTREMWALLVAHATSSYAWMNMGLVVTKRDVGSDTWNRVGSFRQYDWPESTTQFFGEGQAQQEVLVIE